GKRLGDGYRGTASQKTVDSEAVFGDTGRAVEIHRRPPCPAPPSRRRNRLKLKGFTRPCTPPSIPTSSRSPNCSLPSPTVNSWAPPSSPSATWCSRPEPRPSRPPSTGAKKGLRRLRHLLPRLP